MLLKNKTAIITGCNRGIGNAVLQKFAQNGADIYACARSKSVEFEKNCQQLENDFGNSITPLYFDLTEEEQVKAAVKSISAAKTPIHILVNNAGASHGGLFQMTPIRDLRNIFENNFFAQIYFSQYIVRIMAKQKSGVIINIASVAGIDGRTGTIAYGTSKAALILATKTIANELAMSGIRVNAIAPGIINTDMLNEMDEKARNQILNNTALKRFGEAEEVANVALFLASDLSTYMTGQTIRVDGGLSS